jgi:succinate dehydrogenase flavin-adding protein (antitoxin of CptAB toxin-antitoxin module)
MIVEKGLMKGFDKQVTIFEQIIEEVNEKLYKTFLKEGTEDGKSKLQYFNQMKEVKAFLHYENYMLTNPVDL